MESAAVLSSFNGTVRNITHRLSLLERPGVVSFYNANSNKLSFTHGVTVSGRGISTVSRKETFIPCIKASGTTITATSDEVSSDSSSQGPLEKKNMQGTTFPNGFEALVLEVCDETNVAELKLKVGDFEMHLKRNVGATIPPTPVISLSTPPSVPSEPVVESNPVSLPTLPPKPSEIASPFKNVSLEKSSKLAALEASGSNMYVLVSSPTVGSFRRGRTLKGKKQPPICKEGDVIKERQVIGFVDQFGSELPVKSDVAGEVLKLLYNDSEAVGYGDPLIAVLPSFHGIK